MCCLFGLMDYKNYFSGREKTKVISALSRECEARGTDASGIAYIYLNRMRIYKRPFPAHKMHFFIPDSSNAVMGHTRLATQGNRFYNENNHPFKGYCSGEKFALAHNGVIHNEAILRKKLKLPKTRIKTDSYIAVQLLEKEKNLNFSSLRKMAETVEGSFTFTLLDSGENLYFVKGDSPMCIYRYKQAGFYIYASTEEILRSAIYKLKLGGLPYECIETSPGDIIKICRNGNIEVSSFDASHLFENEFGFYYDWQYPAYKNSKAGDKNSRYLQELKDLSGYYGYTPEDIDTLYQEGYSCEEIEDLLYNMEYGTDIF